MPDPALHFESLPADYQQLIQQAEEEHGLAITPLQQLSGGRSGALLYLVRVASAESNELEHLILKLDHKHPKSSSDEISRHQAVLKGSPASFVKAHVPELALERLESDRALAIFYTIAGQSLRRFRTLTSYRQRRRLEVLFRTTNSILLDQWNKDREFEPISHPAEVFKPWLGFRLNAGQKIETFIKDICLIPPDHPGFIVGGELMPNPLHYAREPTAWGSTRPLDIATGRQHGDLNTNNILAMFKAGGDELAGYYLIDFAMFKDGQPLLFDQRYLEMSYLIHSLETGSFESVVSFLAGYDRLNGTRSDEAPIEMAGVEAALRAGRQGFSEWVEANHPSLHDDLWGQYWLAGAAAGLAYCHKAGLPDRDRLAALIFGAANLKQFLSLFDLPLPAAAGQLFAEGQIEAARQLPMQSPRGPRHNLPAPITNLIGRQREIEEVTDLLSQPQVRLLTLTGPGGTGKTRLALEVGRQLAEAFADGAFFIDLADLREPALVIATAAHTLGVREGSGQPPLEKLKDYLAQRQMLLIFDNFEQVTEAAADLANLLAAAPGVTALVTSRVPLRLRGEREYPVSPLEVPGELVDEPSEYEAVALFRQQARAVNPAFELNADNQSAVVEICRRLDGLPLAIEIAAARIKMLTPAALLKRLDQNLDILVSPAPDIPDRQQTLRGAIDWSFQLLEPPVQDLFIRLGIFAGGFTLEAATAICSPMDEAQVFDGVERLLNNSLLRQVHSVSEEPRFDMLQTIRQFALEKAEEQGLLDELGWAHCQYYSQLAGGGMEGGIYGPDSALWLERFEQEHDNFRQVMRWAIDNPDRGVLPLLSMMLQLSWFWYRYGYLQEGSQWMERLLAATEPMGESQARAFALAGRGSLALWSGELKLAARRTKEAMDLGQKLGLDTVISLTNMTHGTTLINQGRDKEAYQYLVNSVELYDQQEQDWLKGTALVHLANVSLGMGDVEQALKWLDTARPLLNATSDAWTMAFGLNNYGEVARVQGDYEAAEEFYLRTRALYQQADSKGDQARLSTALGYIALHKGEYDQAKGLFLRSLREFRKLGNQRGVAEALAGLASLAVELDHNQWAAPLLAAAESLLAEVDGVWWPADRVEIERAHEQLQAELGERYDQLQRQGVGMALAEASQYAEQGW